MASTKFKKVRLAFGLLAGAASLGALPAAAQAQTASSAYREDPGSALTRHLRSLSDNPRSLHALMGAAGAALELGDPQAAITFYARAEEVAPRDPRIKAGFGSAFLQMEQPHSALKFFQDARSLGIAESEIAGDRGLAYDLLGDPKQAQQDYRLALRVRNDPEIERRLALSLAIAGDKAGALAAIHNQVQRQDRAAWRTRAFVLALSGDAVAATQAVRSVMPGAAAAMQPFLSRLPALDAAARAKAVHFGHMPAGMATQVAQATPSASPPGMSVGEPDTTRAGARTASPAPAPSGNAIQASSRLSAAQVQDRSPSRRQSGVPLRAPSRAHPPLSADRPAERKPEPAPTRVAAATPRESQPDPEPSRAGPTQLALSAPAPAAMNAPPSSPPPAASTSPAEPATRSSLAKEALGPPVPADIDAIPAAPPAAAAAQTGALPQTQSRPPAAAAEPAAETAEAASSLESARPETRLAFADVIKAIEGLPTDSPAARSVQPSSTPPPRRGEEVAVEAKPANDAKVAAAPEQAAQAPAKGDAATRHWVQIASAPDNLVDHEYRRLKRKHPGLLSDKEGYRTPMGKSNRVLVGPFDSEDAAKAFVGELKKDRLTAIAWTSTEGQGIDKIPPK